MPNKSNTTPALRIETDIIGFTPTQEQIDTLARRLMPEIKKYFADEQIQKEFAEWQKRNAREDK
jgi:hypothetical protein